MRPRTRRRYFIKQRSRTLAASDGTLQLPAWQCDGKRLRGGEVPGEGGRARRRHSRRGGGKRQRRKRPSHRARRC
eukprot:369622-Pyramimonas_sp.AAC.1